MAIEKRVNNSIDNFQNPIQQYGGKKHSTKKRFFRRNKFNKLKSKRVRFAV
jgi:hypothetical protein